MWKILFCKDFVGLIRFPFLFSASGILQPSWLGWLWYPIGQFRLSAAGDCDLIWKSRLSLSKNCNAVWHTLLYVQRIWCYDSTPLCSFFSILQPCWLGWLWYPIGQSRLSTFGDCNLSDEISRSSSGKGSGPFLKNILEDFIMSGIVYLVYLDPIKSITDIIICT